MSGNVKLFLFVQLALIAYINTSEPEPIRCFKGDTNETFLGAFMVSESTPSETESGIIKRMDTLLVRAQEEVSLLREIVKHLTAPSTVSQREESYNQTSAIGKPFPSTCAEAAAISRKTGLYNIQVDSYSPKPFQVACDEDLHGGGWTVVLRRRDGSVDFFRDWAEYKRGFGNLEGEFFIGLDKLHALTSSHYVQELLFVLEDFDNTRKYANYTSFAVGDESERYNLKTLGKYSGDAGDSFTNHAGHPFKTKDVEDPHKCAEKYTGAWWYTSCHSSNLNGKYLSGAYGKEKYAQGVVWHSWRGHNYSLKFVQMMIRPQRK